MSARIFDAKVHFVAGKGGVGKSLVAHAMAELFSERFTTLLVDLSEEEAGDGEARIATIKKHPSGKYFYCRIYPDQSLYEYLKLKIPQKKLLDSFMSQSLFRALGSAMPGLADLTRLGKIWFHADEDHEPKGQIFDKIVVDMPSSGFVDRFLSIARVVHDAVKIGPLAKEALLINNYFADENNARLHVVTLLQELVVSETIELVCKIKKTKSMHLGHVILNRVLFPQLSDDVSDRKNLGPALSHIADFYSARCLAEKHEHARLAQSNLKLTELSLPDFVGEIDDARIINNMVAIMKHGGEL